jgi:hypothetical protein
VTGFASKAASVWFPVMGRSDFVAVACPSDRRQRQEHAPRPDFGLDRRNRILAEEHLGLGVLHVHDDPEAADLLGERLQKQRDGLVDDLAALPAEVLCGFDEDLAARVRGGGFQAHDRTPGEVSQK